MKNEAQEPSQSSFKKRTQKNIEKSRTLSKMGSPRDPFGRPKGGQRTKACRLGRPREPKWVQGLPQESPGPSQAWFWKGFHRFPIDFFQYFCLENLHKILSFLSAGVGTVAGRPKASGYSFMCALGSGRHSNGFAAQSWPTLWSQDSRSIFRDTCQPCSTVWAQTQDQSVKIKGAGQPEP